MNAKFSLLILTAGIPVLFGAARSLAEVPEQIHYQGRVTVEGVPFEGTGEFKFALVDDGTAKVSTAVAEANVTDGFITSVTVVDGGSGYNEAPEVTITESGGSGAEATAVVQDGRVVEINVESAGTGYSNDANVVVGDPPADYRTFWSHDGTSTDGGEPDSAVSVSVEDGIFSVALGGEGMEPLSAGTFEESPVFLRVWFSDEESDFEELGPDQPVTGVAYSLRTKYAAEAGAVADGTITSESIADSTITGDKIAADIGVWSSGEDGAYSTSSSVGIGTASPDAELEVVGSATFGSENTASGSRSFVGGGLENVASEYDTFVGGGSRNEAQGEGSAVLGGRDNTAGGARSVVAGGDDNTTSGLYGFVAGGENAANDDATTVSGGFRNTASGEATTIGGGRDNRASAEASTVAGGQNNAAIGSRSTVGGGRGNAAPDEYATVGGGYENHASESQATVAGGQDNVASGSHSTVSGGRENEASDWYAAVGGGYRNEALGSRATVGGGADNVADGGRAAVGGGSDNVTNGNRATVAGGWENEATDNLATVGGGRNNVASGVRSTVVGGGDNMASGYRSTVLGGADNIASGEYSIAGGQGSQATEDHTIAFGHNAYGRPRPGAVGGEGSFVFADKQNDSPVYTVADNSFVARAEAVWFISDQDTDGINHVGVRLDGGSWQSISDRNVKKSIEDVDPQEVLARLLQLPISEYTYRSQDPSIRHMGPMAQDFHPLFGLGEDDRHISSMNLAGIALAAIQGVHEKLEEQGEEMETGDSKVNHRIDELRKENAKLRETNADLEKRLARIEALLDGKKVASR